MRRILFGAMVWLLVLGGTSAAGAAGETSPSATGPFPDVDSTHPFAADIAWMAGEGVSTGYPDGTFRPGGTVSRQEMAAFMYRLAGEPPGPFGTTFSDVGPGHPFALPIGWMATTGISTGYPDGTFRPAGLVTRQEMAAFMYRLAGQLDGPFSVAGFSDVGPNHPFALSIGWMATKGVSTGYPNGTFRPTLLVNRGEMSAFVARLAKSPLAWVFGSTIGVDPPNPGDVVDCSDLDSWLDGFVYHRWFFAHYGDVAGLDPDDDRSPCATMHPLSDPGDGLTAVTGDPGGLQTVSLSRDPAGGDPQPGDVLVVGASALTPSGSSWWVHEVTPAGAGWNLGVLPASFMDALPEGGSVSIEDVAIEEAGTVDGTSAIGGGIIRQLSDSLDCGAGASLEVSGSIGLTPTLDKFDLEWANWQIQSTEVLISTTMNAQMGVSISGEASCTVSTDDPVISITNLPVITVIIPVGPVPLYVPLHPRIDVRLAGSVSVEGEISAGVNAQATATTGLSYQAGQGWTPVKSYSDSYGYDEPSAEAEGEIEARVPIALSLNVGGLVGPSVNIDPYAKARVQWNQGTAPCWQVIAGVGAGVGINFAVPYTPISINHYLPDLITAETVVAEATDTEGPACPPDPPEGVTGEASEDKEQVTLNWTANSEGDLAGYRVYRLSGTTPDLDSATLIGSTPGTQLVDLAPVKGQINRYVVTAYDDHDLESDPSEIVEVDLGGCVNPEAVCIPDGEATVVFTPTGATCLWTWVLNWGDGSPVETLVGTTQVTVSHTYAAPGEYLVVGSWTGEPLDPFTTCTPGNGSILFEYPETASANEHRGSDGPREHPGPMVGGQTAVIMTAR